MKTIPNHLVLITERNASSPDLYNFSAGWAETLKIFSLPMCLIFQLIINLLILFIINFEYTATGHWGRIGALSSSIKKQN
jgi:hypothetical protein